jgi:hypothetical protein
MASDSSPAFPDPHETQGNSELPKDFVDSSGAVCDQKISKFFVSPWKNPWQDTWVEREGNTKGGMVGPGGSQ